jgi:hypothetical protein
VDTDTTPVDTDTTPVDTDTTPVDTDTTPVDTGPPPECGFQGAPGPWAIPGGSFRGSASLTEITSELDCPGNDEIPAHDVVDVNGDGAPDLVVTDRCDPGGGGAVGEDYWEVHLNNGAGFDVQPVQWSIPGRVYNGDESFDLLRNEQDCGGRGGAAQPATDLIDLDGDDLPDFVVVDPCNEPDVGERFWRVHFNNGAGFDAAVSNWSLPGTSYGGDETFDTLEAEQVCQGGDAQPTYGTRDITGDGLPDLIVTDECPNGDVGESRWKIFVNTGSGFAAAPTDFTLPGSAYLGDESFDDFTAPLDCNAGGSQEPAYDLLDVDGDAFADLVLTATCEAGSTVGEVGWRVYYNVGTGFSSTASVWDVPGSLYAGALTFDALEAPQDCANANRQPTYGARDLDGDGAPELVIVDECDVGGAGNVGERYWLYYANDGTGFGTTPLQFLIPGTSFVGNESLDGFTGALNCAPGIEEPAYTSFDLDGDGLLDLVITDTCNVASVGETQWSISTVVCVTP